ncbi:MAG: amidohydrolase [Planctomycetes bacterium]|nr:amidohydrolase [Planctomycetota bacterium]MCB9904338.1 amidohydrolase [Planctomycetota bacterium]
MQVIDFHSHFFCREFFDALVAQSPFPGDDIQRLVELSERTGIEIPERDLGRHTQRWLDEMDAKGLDHLVTFASLPEETAAVSEAARLSKGRMSAIALVNPKAPEAPKKVRKLLTDFGFKGVLIFPAMHHYEIDGPEARAVYEVLAEFEAPVYVHCGLLVVTLRDLLGIRRTQDINYANPLRIVPAANDFPAVPFVIPHFGAGFFRETLMAGSQCANVHTDTSSTNSWTKTQPEKLTLRDVFERALGVFGPDRILFGTDSNVFPAGWRADRRAEQRELLCALEVPEADQQKIFAGNAKRLLGL